MERKTVIVYYYFKSIYICYFDNEAFHWSSETFVLSGTHSRNFKTYLWLCMCARACMYKVSEMFRDSWISRKVCLFKKKCFRQKL